MLMDGFGLLVIVVCKSCHGNGNAPPFWEHNTVYETCGILYFRNRIGRTRKQVYKLGFSKVTKFISVYIA